MSLQEGNAVGLDLGTTYSCIGVYRNGGVEIIPNRNGDRTTPSIVTIVDGNTILKGEETLEYLVKNYDSSIYAIKRFIGRDFNDNSVKEEIKFENFPFKIVPDKQGKYPLILVDKDNKEIKFTVEEISSFVIRKMVDSAESYLGKKVSKLVITVPANFNDAQRQCTKNAAKLAGIEVLRIINEPTAAALAYGIGEKKNETDSGEEKKILVFDLGGGTFDVTILKINYGKEQNFEILSTKGDKFLGGEDFDNKLVEHFLEKFCKNMKESKETIKKDKKAIKKLKIACENIKRVLSNSLESTLSITNFYNGNDIFENIERKEFEKLCQPLFDKLQSPIEDALSDAKLSRNEISEIVLVGGSSRIPKVKSFLKEYFEGVKINDTINPDETIAYGATLMAAKILNKKDDETLKGFNLMDITPLSLGLNVKNPSEDPEIKKEGHLMSVLIKRGSKIPYSNSKLYETSFDNQTYINVVIYEGEKKYTKYNHILGKLEMTGIPPKKKGEVKVEVTFFVDVNGILTVTANEKTTGQTIQTKIKNDMVGLTDEDIENLRKKNEKFLAKNMMDKKIDYTNLKDSLKTFQDSLKEAEDDEDRYDILMNYNNTLEEFIDKFETDFDNETMTEKYYIYVKDLIISYSKVLNIKSQISKGDTEIIIKNITKYLKVFSKLSSGYLDELLEIMKGNMAKKIFLEIVVNVLEQLNECGKKCLEEMKKFCRYHSLLYFEKSNLYFKKYIGDVKKLSVCSKAVMDKCKEQVKYSNILISQIHSGAILLCEDSLRMGELIQSTGTGFTNNRLVLQLSPQDDNEKYQIVLNNYEKMLSEFSNEPTKKEAICNANIIKICHRFLGYTNYKRYVGLGERCEFIVKQLNIDREEKWYKDFLEIYQEVKDLYITIGEPEMKEIIRKKYKKKFEEISNKFNKRKNTADFINFVLKLRPYNGYDEDIKNGKKVNGATPENLKYLLSKYHPDKYTFKEEDENSFDRIWQDGSHDRAGGHWSWS